MSVRGWSRHDTPSRFGEDAGLVLILLFLTIFSVWWFGYSVDWLASTAELDRLAWCETHQLDVQAWAPYDPDPCMRAWERR